MTLRYRSFYLFCGVTWESCHAIQFQQLLESFHILFFLDFGGRPSTRASSGWRNFDPESRGPIELIIGILGMKPIS